MLTLHITIRDDQALEGDEYFTFKVQNLNGTDFKGNGPFTINIADNDRKLIIYEESSSLVMLSQLDYNIRHTQGVCLNPYGDQAHPCIVNNDYFA